jgi:hypothetical protein
MGLGIPFVSSCILGMHRWPGRSALFLGADVPSIPKPTWWSDGAQPEKSPDAKCR